MDTLTPDEINALCEIPEDTYATLAMQVTAEAVGRGERLNLDAMDRAVLALWYGRQERSNAG